MNKKLATNLNSTEQIVQPLNLVQEEFSERAFCIVGDEMKAKMVALGLNEEGILKISYENENHEILELIDKYFTQIQELKIMFEEKYHKEFEKYKDDMSKHEFKKMIYDETKSGLLAYVSYHKGLTILISKYPGKLIDVFEKSYFSDFMYLLQYSSNGEKYQFDFDLAVEFFELAEKIEIERKGGEDRYDAFDGICYAYENLYEKIKTPELFNDLLKLCISGGKSECINLLKTLKNFDKQSDIEMLKKHYQEIIKLGIIAGKNNSTFFNSPHLMGKIIRFIKKNEKLKDLIISGIEKLGPDFIYVFNSNSGFIKNTIERFPNRFIEFCENLKKLADYSENNNTFYGRCLIGITDFIKDYPDKWDYLLKIGEIFGKNSPGILSIGKKFVYELLKHFPNNYEEILLKTQQKLDILSSAEKELFYTWGLKFLANFLDKDIKNFFYTLDNVIHILQEKINSTYGKSIFFIDGLSFIEYYMFWFPKSWPEIGEKITKIINKHWNTTDENFFRQFIGGFNNYIDSKIIDQDLQLLNDLLTFLEKVGGSKDALRIISSLKDYDENLNDEELNEEDLTIINSLKKGNQKSISFTLAYLLKHKKSKIIPFIQNLNLIKDLNLGVNINLVLLGGVYLEYKSNEELEELFTGEKAEDTKIWNYFIKIGGQNFADVKRWISQIKQSKKIDRTKLMPYLLKIQNVYAYLILEYFENIIHKKIYLKFRREFGLSKDFDDSLINENLLEFYKMYSGTRLNKKHAFELIQKYLNGEVYNGTGDIFKTYPYNRQENKDFLSETLKDKTSVWLSRNEKVYDIEENENGEEKVDNIADRITHHLKVANEKLKLLEIKDKGGKIREFKDYIKLLKFFELLKKDKEKYDTSIFADLELQVNAIKDLLKNKSTKKVSKIKIYHELDPFKIAMMGNWVDKSCLSYYSTVGNYWSAITNALEVNKGVFYIEDEYGNITARVLVGIDKNGNFDTHPIYYKGNLNLNLGKYFMSYIYSLSNEIGNSVEGNRNVKLLFCEKWYSGD